MTGVRLNGWGQNVTGGFALLPFLRAHGMGRFGFLSALQPGGTWPPIQQLRKTAVTRVLQIREMASLFNDLGSKDATTWYSGTQSVISLDTQAQGERSWTLFSRLSYRKEAYRRTCALRGVIFGVHKSVTGHLPCHICLLIHVSRVGETEKGCFLQPVLLLLQTAGHSAFQTCQGQSYKQYLIFKFEQN